MANLHVSNGAWNLDEQDLMPPIDPYKSFSIPPSNPINPSAVLSDTFVKAPKTPMSIPPALIEASTSSVSCEILDNMFVINFWLNGGTYRKYVSDRIVIQPARRAVFCIAATVAAGFIRLAEV